jgi:hypothetical protein
MCARVAVRANAHRWSQAPTATAVMATLPKPYTLTLANSHPPIDEGNARKTGLTKDLQQGDGLAG